MQANPQYDRTTCYFCHEQDEHILETHHIVPQRHSGSDDAENLVRVCPTCHERLERLYDKRFYDALGVETDADDTDEHKTARMVEEEKEAKRIINEIEQDWPEGAPAEIATTQIQREFETEQARAEEMIELLKQLGEVYEPNLDHLRTA